ncbi:MAG: glycosyltransferase family 1 protein [Planctomycetota bacterium]|nr:MAG: glycosyltransferase family 1 protein [Planctomycetota bacterium]
MARLLFLAVDGWHFANHQQHVAAAAAACGHEVEVAVGADEHVGRIRRSGLRCHPLPLRKTRRPAAALRALGAMTDLLRDRRPDLVQLSSLRVGALGGIAARRAGVPVVVRVLTGTGYVFTAGSALLRRMVETLWRRGGTARTWTVFQNAADRDLFLSRGLAVAERTVLIPGAGVDLARFRPRPEPPGPPVVLFLGRMLRAKGVPELIAASGTLRAQGLEHRLLLAGEPDPGNPTSLDRAWLTQRTKAGETEWLGFRNDPEELLAACALLALPTKYGEGLPRVLQEAAACGRPVVATDLPGCRQAVAAGRTGILVPPGDQGGLVEALRGLLTDSSLRSRMGREARRRAEAEFDRDRLAAAFLDLYDRALAAASAGSQPA